MATLIGKRCTECGKKFYAPAPDLDKCVGCDPEGHAPYLPKPMSNKPVAQRLPGRKSLDWDPEEDMPTVQSLEEGGIVLEDRLGEVVDEGPAKDVDPDPTPAPAPEPTPAPDPEPTPEPEPAPEPAPEPEPQPKPKAKKKGKGKAKK